ncbi:MAG: hypothetical protein LBM39_00050 [Candidatus Methanoplasma sp.]|jgi:hypothetical protein|nr:hypothetical protein [Candidatus Methanoplasma sp.]
MIVIGSIVGIASVFTVWFAGDLSIFNMQYTGWEMSGSPDADYYKWMPLIVLVSSVAALASGILSFFRKREGGIIASLLGAVILLAVLAYVLYSSTLLYLPDMAVTAVSPMWLYEYAGIGIWLVIVAAILLIVGGSLLAVAEGKAERSAE